MHSQLADLLALLPEEKHAAFIEQLPPEAAQLIASEPETVDDATLTTIADAVWACLEA